MDVLEAVKLMGVRRPLTKPLCWSNHLSNLHRSDWWEGMIVAVAVLFVLAMAGLLWQVFRLSDDLSRGLVLQETELRWMFLLLGVAGVAGLSGLTLAVVSMRCSTKVLEQLVDKRTAELAEAIQRAHQMAQDKAQILSTVKAFFIGVDASGTICE